MERVSSFLSNRSSRSNSATSNTILHEKSELPPPSQHKKTKLRMRALLGHCLYRRVTLWSVLILVIMSMVLLKTAVHTKNGRVVGGDGFLSGNSPEEQNTNHPVWIGYKQ